MLLSGNPSSICQARADHAEMFVVAKAPVANEHIPASRTAQIRDILCAMAAR
jgi:hypothetical protein